MMPVTHDDVRNAYRFILGREPESDEVVEHHQREADSIEGLRATFLFSPEFRATFPELPHLVPLVAPTQAIETTADPAALRAMIAKMGVVWKTNGEIEPHYSVLSLDEYRPDRFAENESRFFESGKDDLDLLLAVLRRIGRPVESFNRCLEFGCGVGRVTAYLAATFSEVVALDISCPHLQLAKAYLKKLRRHNVTFLQVTAENLHPASGYDLWFSRLVLQHNPPPVTLAILDGMFAELASQGVALVHVPTYHKGYSFSISDYLADRLPPEHMHMHATPQKPILELAWRHGCRPVDIREEVIPDRVINIFVFLKVE
jgi:SAM-dependent methyltransferase